MRTISGGHPPPSLAEWKRAETVDAQRRYEMLPTEVKDAIRDQRVRDQHYLCAYTQRRIGRVIFKGSETWDAHVEHVITQKSSRARGELVETVDYGNMVACVDCASSLPYGAAARGDTVDPLPVTPFHSNCVSRFRYLPDGRVEGVDDAGRRTVSTLKLDHTALNDLRKNEIGSRGIGIPRPPTPRVRRLPLPTVSPAEARRLAREVVVPDGFGRLPEFCEALAQLYEAHALRVEKQRAKAGFARRGD